MLKIKNVTKTFGDIIALRNISFEIKDGEFVFITGPSGSGKTTLLRLILREVTPDNGKIEVDGIDVGNLSKKEIPLFRQQIGSVFQDFKVLDDRTVRENVEIALAVTKVPQEKWQDKVEKVLKTVGLVERANLFPRQLSGGELQRVSLARALVTDPKLILADEPTGNLDWDTSYGIVKLLDQINEKGKTILMATHHKLIVDKMKKRTIDLGNKTREKEK